jgi:hypothetical protein
MAGTPFNPSALTRLAAVLAAAGMFVANGREAFAQTPAAVPADASAKAASRDLARFPELILDEDLAKPMLSMFSRVGLRKALQNANQLNKKETDGFVVDLINKRADLSGLPFVMDADCRMDQDRQRPFAMAGESIHQAIGEIVTLRGRAGVVTDAFQRHYWELDAREIGLPEPNVSGRVLPAPAWVFLHLQKLALQKRTVPESAPRPIAAAQVAALMQVLAPERAEWRVALANYLGRIPYPEATRALARLAIFSDEAEVRAAARLALQSRNGADYGDVLAYGLGYPLPEVAERASKTIALLNRGDMVPDLIGVLERPEPSAPRWNEIDGTKVLEVREVVRVNHHRNCLLCHAPGNTPDVPATVLKAQIPVPGEPFPSQQSYGHSHSEFVVRLDVTYLRQDFSRYLPVANPGAWPNQQRFDFLVRTRTLTDQEAKAHLDRAAAGPESPSPYHRAAAAALRELTGRDAAPTAAAWRRILEKGR